MHVFGLLCITYVYAKPNKTRKMCGKNMHARANQNAQVQMQNVPIALRANQRCTCTVCANHNAHGSRLTSRLYTRALNVYFYVINLSCTRRLFYVYFQ